MLPLRTENPRVGGSSPPPGIIAKPNFKSIDLKAFEDSFEKISLKLLVF